MRVNNWVNKSLNNPIEIVVYVNLFGRVFIYWRNCSQTHSRTYPTGCVLVALIILESITLLLLIGICSRLVGPESSLSVSFSVFDWFHPTSCPWYYREWGGGTSPPPPKKKKKNRIRMNTSGFLSQNVEHEWHLPLQSICPSFSFFLVWRIHLRICEDLFLDKVEHTPFSIRSFLLWKKKRI